VGLISGILLLPLAPVRGVAWVAEVVAEEAERELSERESPERALAELEVARATGELSDEDAEALETQLIEEMLARRGDGGNG
jgi:hypothetical protein